MRRGQAVASSAAAVALAVLACTPRDDRTTPERMLQSCFAALQQDDPVQMRRCYSPHWAWYEVLEKLGPQKREEYARYRREVLARSTVELADRHLSPDGNPDVLFIVPRYHRPDGGVEVDGALWTELHRIDGQWVIWAEHNDLFE
jgi:hypothetical protein